MSAYRAGQPPPPPPPSLWARSFLLRLTVRLASVTGLTAVADALHAHLGLVGMAALYSTVGACAGVAIYATIMELR